jgi:hypothetical protein
MARPRIRRTDHGKIKVYLRDVQQRRFGALQAFLQQLQDSKLQEDAKTDDELFSSIIGLGVEEYGVRQAKVAEAIGISAAAVGRWSKKINLPPPYVRGAVIQALAAIIEDDVGKQEKDQSVLRRGRVMH